MGEVYRARDTRLNRDVAIKVITDVSGYDPVRRKRFEQEARAAAALNHPNITAVYQLGSYEGMPYLVTELLEGETLRERIDRGPLPLRTVVQYAAQIARGLAAAHQKGIIHRDLKPENLFLTQHGQAKILDFGLARNVMAPIVDPSGAHEARTETGVVMGTAGYMSPEQVRGKQVDHRSDIFSFSTVLHEMITGKRAFHKSTSVETMTSILNEEPEPVGALAPTTPLALQRVVLRGLEKDPDLRFQSASDMAFALESLAEAVPTTTTAGPVVTKEPAKLRPGVIAAALAGVTGIAAIAFFMTRAVPEPTVANYVQLTQDGNQKSILGTDGSRIYLSLITSAVESLSVVPATGGDQTRVTLPSSDMAPVSLSTDGTQFLLVQGKGIPPTGPLWSLSVIGGSARRLGDISATTATLSPDGKLLVFARDGDIFLAQSDGSSPHKLVSVNGVVSELVWSPDGRRIRFTSSDGFGPGIGQHMMWEMNVDGSELHRLLAGWHTPPDECCGRWTPDGKYFVFQSGGQIWALPRGNRYFSPNPQPIRLTSSPMSLHSPVPSRDGSKLYVVGKTFRGELSAWNAKTKVFEPFLGGISAEYVSFSHDGQWVAYVTYPQGSLWKSRVDGSGKVQLTFPPYKPILPRWSPDGRTIIFFEYPRSSVQPARVFELASDGGSPRALLPSDQRNEQDPTWSPDGTKIVFAGDASDALRSKAEPAIRVLDLTDGKVTAIPGSQGLFSPRWSPDGRWIAALTSDSRTVEVYDVRSQQWSVLATGTIGWINWSKDSNALYMLDFTGRGSVVKVHLGSHELEQVVDLSGFVTTGQFGGTLAITPSDDPLLLRDTGTQDVYSLDWTQP
jgi:eukaryotic-like serine/threonine-protein kinase